MIAALLAIPLLGALVGGLARPPWPRWVALAALLAEGTILVRGLAGRFEAGLAPTYSPFGTSLILTPTGTITLLVAALVVLVSLAATGGESREPEIAAVGLVGLFGVGFAMVAGASLVLAALALGVVACVLTIALVRSPATPPTYQAGRRYLVWLTLASSALVFSGVLDHLYTREPSAGILGPVGALFVVGIAITTAALPFSLWLPGLCGESPTGAALTVGLLTSTAVAILSGALGATPWLLSEPGARLGLAVLGAGAGVLGAFLALGEKDPARCFAYLISANADFILAGLAASPPGASAGATWAFLAQALAGALGLACLGGDRRGLAGLFWRRPALAIGVAVAAGSLIGLPLTAGFVGRWAVATAFASQNPVPLLITALACVLGGLAALRDFGNAFVRAEGAPESLRFFDVVALALTAVLLVGGLIPGPVLGLLSS
jgi:formate hydrogenlyase subunit 3/multisubunit Na+/H+ antiporter MnhD subunit